MNVIKIIGRFIKKYWIMFWKKINNTFKNYSNLTTLIVALLGLIFLWYELVQFAEQNALTEHSMKQTYRPLGVINPDTTKIVVYNYAYTDSTIDSIYTFDRIKNLRNLGKGFLFFIGSFNFNSYNLLNMNKNIIQIINQNNFEIFHDRVVKDFRLKLLLPGGQKSVDTQCKWENLISKKEYYLYSVFLYSDQDGNLYDTVHLDHLRYDKPFTIKEKSLPRLTNEYFHEYTKEEQNEAKNFLKSRYPLLAEFIVEK